MRREPGRELRDCCSCNVFVAGQEGVSLLQAAVLAQGVLAGTASSAAAPHDVHLKWG